MKLPLVETEDGIYKLPDNAFDRYNFPSDVDRIPVSHELLEDELHLTSSDSSSQEGVFVGVCRPDEYYDVEYKSAYILSHIYQTSSGLYKATLKPTHGGSRTLTAEQTYKYDNKFKLRRRAGEYVKGGLQFVLKRVNTQYLCSQVRDEEKSVVYTI